MKYTNICIFAHLKDELPKSHDQKMYTCVHGKTLTWDTARKWLGMTHGLHVFVGKDEVKS